MGPGEYLLDQQTADHKAKFIAEHGAQAYDDFITKGLDNFLRTGDPNQAAEKPAAPQIRTPEADAQVKLQGAATDRRSATDRGANPQILWEDKVRGVRLEPTSKPQIRSADQSVAVDVAVRAKLREIKARLIQLSAVAITAVFGGVPVGMAINEAKTITKEVEKIVKVPFPVETIKYVDRVVEKPVPAKPFIATCPQDGFRFWVYPASTGQVAPAAKKKGQ